MAGDDELVDAAGAEEAGRHSPGPTGRGPWRSGRGFAASGVGVGRIRINTRTGMVTPNP